LNSEVISDQEILRYLGVVMEKLMGYLFALLLCVFSSNIFFAQKLEQPIVVHPIIGEKLDRAEEEYFKLFPTIENFQEAEFYLNADSSLKAIVIFELNEELRDTVLENFVSIYSLKNYIDQKLTAEINAEQIVDRGRYVTALNLDGTKKTGELLSIRDSSFLLLNMEESIYLNNTNSTFDVSHIQLVEMQKITSVDKTNIAKYIYPIVTGITAVLIYSSTVKPVESNSIGEGVNKAAGQYLIGALIGGLGCLLGLGLASAIPIWSVSETEYDSPFNEEDIEGLRYSARYQWGEPYYLQKVE
jgi:hypothetical protein